MENTFLGEKLDNCHWVKEFQQGRSSFEYENDEVTTLNQIDAVDRMVEENRRVIYSKIYATLGIETTAI